MFLFNQPNNKECGYRCLYYVLNIKEDYEKWLNDNFKVFNPKESGITFNDICQVLKHYGKEYYFTEISEKGTYIIYSGIFLHSENPPRKHGHYFIYQNGIIYCSTRQEPYKLNLSDLVKRIKGKTTEEAYRCLEIKDKQ